MQKTERRSKHSSKGCVCSDFAFHGRYATGTQTWLLLLFLHFPLKAPFSSFLLCGTQWLGLLL